MENIYWKKTVGTLIGAIWLYTLADLAASITGAVNELLNPSGIMGMLKDLMEDGNGAPTLSIGDIIESMFSILVIVGYYLFFRSLTRFARLQPNQQDGEHVSTVRTAYILLLVALIVDFVPMIGWLASFVLMVIAYVKMLSGYRGLKKSYTFPSEARQGAATLYSCTIWTLVGYVLGCIPLFGSIIEGIITLVVFFTILSAWGRIKDGAPNMTLEEEEIYKRDEVPAYKQILGDALIIYFFILVASSVLDMLCQEISFGTSPWVYIGYKLFWTLAIVVVYVWLLCSPKARLNLGAKVGLGVLLIGRVLGVLNIFIESRMIADTSLLELTGSAVLVCFVIGMLLFIWSTSASLSLKIVISCYILLSQALWRLFSMQMRAIPNNISDYHETISRLYSNCACISLGIQLLTLILVYYFVSQWKKQPIDSEIANN